MCEDCVLADWIRASEEVDRHEHEKLKAAVKDVLREIEVEKPLNTKISGGTSAASSVLKSP